MVAALRERQDAMQQKTFTKWWNSYLRERDVSLRVVLFFFFFFFCLLFVSLRQACKDTPIVLHRFDISLPPSMFARSRWRTF